MNLSDFNPKVANEWHPTKNGSLTPSLVSQGSHKKVWWLGKCGHEWEAYVYHRSRNSGCPICSGSLIIAGINDIATLYPEVVEELWSTKKNLPLIPESLGKGSNTKAWWECSQGHEWQAPVFRIISKQSSCPTCAGQQVLPGFNDFETWFPLLAKEWHPTKNGHLKPSDITKASHKKVWWKCPEGHEWEVSINQRTSAKRSGKCPICLGRKIIVGINDLNTVNPLLAAEWHQTKNGTLTPSQVSVYSSKKAWWICDLGHEWEAPIYSRTRKNGCIKCGLQISTAEKEIVEYFTNLGFHIETSNKSILNGKEIDIYLPDQKFGVEFNGIYWHNENKGKGKYYHYDKWLAAKAAGVQLVQIWEDDWNRNKQLILLSLATKLKASTATRIYARKTFVEEVDIDIAKDFLQKNHIQGYGKGSTYIALKTFSGKNIVALLALKKEHSPDIKTFNIIRYATNANVIGGFTKILKYIEKTYSPDKVLTFSDHCISDGGLYSNNGFIADKEVAPDYMYIVSNQRKHKFGYRLKRFQNDPKLIWKPDLTERELAKLNKLPRIWDAGKTRWVKEYNFQ